MKTYKKFWLQTVRILFGIVCLISITNLSYGDFLNQEQYINKVKENNPQIKDIEYTKASITKKLQEVYRAYSVYLNADASYSDDHNRSILNPASVFFQDVDMTAFNLDLSVNKEFNTGTIVTLGYGTQETTSKYPFIGSDYTYGTTAPYIKLEQSLLKNFKGKLTEASIAKAKASAKSLLYLQIYKEQQLLLNAKKAYWKLAYARTVNIFRQNSLARTQKTLDWNQRRYNKDLAEKTDLLQSKAAYKIRELNLKLAKADEIQASRTFNEFINISSDKVDFEIENIEKLGEKFKDIKGLERNDGKRADTLSVISAADSYVYAQKVASKNIGSDLKITGKYALNAADSNISDSFSQLKADKYSSFTIGLNYSLPLDFSVQKSVIEGYDYDIMSSKKQIEQAELSESNGWLQLLQDWDDAKTEYLISRDVFEIQQERNKEEQKLLRTGRSTTYQVLESEQDLDDAILSVYQTSMNAIFVYLESEMLYNTKKITLE
ncbi:MAG: TolC family protein [Endomicrobiaceae bacterium]